MKLAGGFFLDIDRQALCKGEPCIHIKGAFEEIKLDYAEKKLLFFLAKTPNIPVSSETLKNKVIAGNNGLKQRIYSLRGKLEPVGKEIIKKTPEGYKLVTLDEKTKIDYIKEEVEESHSDIRDLKKRVDKLADGIFTKKQRDVIVASIENVGSRNVRVQNCECNFCGITKKNLVRYKTAGLVEEDGKTEEAVVEITECIECRTGRIIFTAMIKSDDGFNWSDAVDYGKSMLNSK